LSAVEQYSRKKFRYRNEIGVLIEIAEHSGRRPLLDDLTFYSKFATHASRILKSAGHGSTETVKLSAEFQDAIEKISTILRVLVKDADPETRDLVIPRFASLSPEGLGLLLALCEELSWVKNYTLDAGRAHR